jgi:hypothetical protein
MLSAAAQEVLARENRARLRAYDHIQLPLELPGRGGRALVFPLATLTWRHCRDLAKLDNAFFVPGATPQRGDYFELLWRLHPYYRSDAGRYANLPRDDRRPGPFRSWLSRKLVLLACWNLDIVAAEIPLRLRLKEARNDQPAVQRKDAGTDLLSQLAPVNALDDAAEFLTGRGLNFEEVLDFPVAVFYQIQRRQIIGEGKAELFLSEAGKLLEFEPEPEVPTEGSK